MRLRVDATNVAEADATRAAFDQRIGGDDHGVGVVLADASQAREVEVIGMTMRHEREIGRERRHIEGAARVQIEHAAVMSRLDRDRRAVATPTLPRASTRDRGGANPSPEWSLSLYHRRMTDHARQRILLRRAQFVTAALAALSPACSKVNDVPHADPSNKPLPPPASATASSQPEAALPDGLPPLDTPVGVSAIARTEFERLATKVRAVSKSWQRRRTASRRATLPTRRARRPSARSPIISSRPSKASTSWARAVRQMKDAKLVDTRVEQHGAFAEKERLEKIRKKLAAKLDEQGPAANKAWADIFDAAVHANPEPCLKYACPEW